MNWFLIKNRTDSMMEALALYKEANLFVDQHNYKQKGVQAFNPVSNAKTRWKHGAFGKISRGETPSFKNMLGFHDKQDWLGRIKTARAPRDYKREYSQYHSKPERVAERSTRNKARRKLGLTKGDPREVDHKIPLKKGGSNARSNLRAVSLQTNRRKFTKTAGTATKTNPGLWEKSKQQAKSRMGGKHSARAMQLATKIYKSKGGGYSGAKPSSKTNSLKKWSKQDWGYSGKDKPGQGGSGVYLPKAKRDRLKSTDKGRKQLASATRKKHKATASGQQYSSHGLAANTSLKRKKR